MPEDVDLSDLQRHLDQSAVPLVRRGLPTFVLGLSLFDSAGLLIGRPAFSGLVVQPGPGGSVPTGSLVTAALLHALLLGFAILLRYDTPLAGTLRPKAEEETWSGARLRAILAGFGPAGRDGDGATIRRVFGWIFAALTAVGALALISGIRSLFWIPVVALGWVVMTAGIAWIGAFFIAQRSPPAALGYFAAALLALLLMLVPTGLRESVGLLVAPCVLFACGLACFLFIATCDPSRERVFRLISAASYPGGVCKLEPDFGRVGRVFLKFQLREDSPILAFSNREGEQDFSPIAVVTSAAPVPLHEMRLWIWNMARLAELADAELELQDRDGYIRSTARITKLLRTAATQEARPIGESALEAAAQNILVPGFAKTLQTALVEAFHEHASQKADLLAGRKRELLSLGSDIAALDDLRMGNASNKGDFESIADLKTKWETIEKEFDDTLAKLKATDDSTALADAWHRRLEALLCSEGRGSVKLKLTEAHEVVALLGLNVTVIKTEDGPTAAELKAHFSELRAEVNKRFAEERDRRKRREDLEHEESIKLRGDIIKGLLNDPVSAARVAEAFAKDPGQLAKMIQLPRTGAEPPDGAADDPADGARPGTPRNRN